MPLAVAKPYEHPEVVVNTKKAIKDAEIIESDYNPIVVCLIKSYMLSFLLRTVVDTSRVAMVRSTTEDGWGDTREKKERWIVSSNCRRWREKQTKCTV